jgi:hypothetical protein
MNTFYKLTIANIAMVQAFGVIRKYIRVPLWFMIRLFILPLIHTTVLRVINLLILKRLCVLKVKQITLFGVIFDKLRQQGCVFKKHVIPKSITIIQLNYLFLHAASSARWPITDTAQIHDKNK